MATNRPQIDDIRRAHGHMFQAGYTATSTYAYRDSSGADWCYRIRFEHSTERKKVLPMHFDGERYVGTEPKPLSQGKLLYRLPELMEADRDQPVFIVEGEKCADALAALGLVVTTSGSCSSANDADWTPLRGKECIVFPDNDKVGAAYAASVAAKLVALGCAVEAVDIAALSLPDKGDCVDWLGAHPTATAADILGLARISGFAGKAGNAAPELLRRPVPPPQPYPMEELGDLLGPACKSLSRVIQAPMAVCASSLIAAVSLGVQALADVHNDGREHPLSLWFLTVAESGERKSAVDAEAMRSAREHEKAQLSGHAANLQAYENKRQQWDYQRELAKKAASKSGGEGLADALDKLGPPPTLPMLPMLTAADFTAEGLARMLAAGRPAIGAFTDEASLVFGGHGMTQESVSRTAGTLSKLWDNGTLDRIRATEGALKLYGRRLALHLMAQPVIAERALSNAVLAGQGFLARCLLAWPESTAGNRPYRQESLRDDPHLIRFHGRLAAIFNISLPLFEGCVSELRPRPLPLSPGAFAAWRAFHDEIERSMGPGGIYALVRPWASKAPEQCLRMAGVFTMFEDPNASEIDARTIERAAEIVLWHLGEAARLAGVAETSSEVRDAVAILDWCHQSMRTLLHSSVALTHGPSRIREGDTFHRAMKLLVAAGWAFPIDGGAVVDGKQRKFVWNIVAAPTE